MSRSCVLVAALLMTAQVTEASAQGTPAASAQSAQASDTPSIAVGALLYADWTMQTSPKTPDADGNLIHPNSFNITRSYINLRGQLSHRIAFRITPDIVRETDTGGTTDGSLIFRIKFAYAQFNLDDWMTKGSYVRLGIQPTPWLDFIEGIYRYRFQGTMYPEREGYFRSADAGVSFHTELPREYGDVHVGIFNGENYTSVEVNDQKAIMVRGTVRPFAAASALLRGVRASVFYDADHYVANAERTRFISALSFEHRRVRGAVEYLDTHDQQSATRPGLTANVEGRGFSLWATPRVSKGWEGLLRYDHHAPDTTFTDRVHARTILGVAYWFPLQGTVTSALLVDYDSQSFLNAAPSQPKQTRVAIHGMVSF